MRHTAMIPGSQMLEIHPDSRCTSSLFLATLTVLRRDVSSALSLSYTLWFHAASFKEGLSQVAFSWKLPNSTLCLSWRYDCYSADNGLCAAGAKTEIDVLAIQRTSTDTSINRLPDSTLPGCFDGVFSNRTQSQQRNNKLFGKKQWPQWEKREASGWITKSTDVPPEWCCEWGKMMRLVVKSERLGSAVVCYPC